MENVNINYSSTVSSVAEVGRFRDFKKTLNRIGLPLSVPAVIEHNYRTFFAISLKSLLGV